MSTLSDLLRSRQPKGWSARQVAREARKRGHEMSDATATAYLGGRHGVPSDQILDAFADTLRIPIDQLRSAAGLVTQVGEPWQPPPASRYLREDQRQALERLIVTMVDREQGGGAHEDRAAPMNDPDSGPDQRLRAVADGGSTDDAEIAAAEEAIRKGKAEQLEAIEAMKKKRGEKE